MASVLAVLVLSKGFDCGSRQTWASQTHGFAAVVQAEPAVKLVPETSEGDGFGRNQRVTGTRRIGANLASNAHERPKSLWRNSTPT